MTDKLSENKLLIQLDLSHNGIKSTEIPVMNEGLSKNHTLVGLHLNGNQMSLDISGMIVEGFQDRKLIS